MKIILLFTLVFATLFSEPDDTFVYLPEQNLIHNQNDLGEYFPSATNETLVPIEYIELTTDLAKRAIDSYLMMRSNFSTEDYGDPGDAENFAASVQNSKSAQSIMVELKKHGFDDLVMWSKAFMSVGVTASLLYENEGSDDFQASIDALKNDPDVPEDIRQQLIEDHISMLPPKIDIKVVKTLLADPVYGPRIDEMLVDVQ